MREFLLQVVEEAKIIVKSVMHVQSCFTFIEEIKQENDFLFLFLN